MYPLRADLSYVFTASDASQPIKTYNPELMVTTVYDSDWPADHGGRSGGEEKMVQMVKLAMPRSDSGWMIIVNYITAIEYRVRIVSYQQLLSKSDLTLKPFVFFPFCRLHTLVVGPGLGRDKSVLRASALILSAAREQGLPLVIYVRSCVCICTFFFGFRNRIEQQRF